MTTQYAVKYQLSNTHVGRLHDSIAQVAIDLTECRESQKYPSNSNASSSLMRDTQGVGVVAIEDGEMRSLTENEMEDLRYEANLG